MKCQLLALLSVAMVIAKCTAHEGHPKHGLLGNLLSLLPASVEASAGTHDVGMKRPALRNPSNAGLPSFSEPLLTSRSAMRPKDHPNNTRKAPVWGRRPSKVRFIKNTPKPRDVLMCRRGKGCIRTAVSPSVLFP